jgi:hypothetical protein
VKCPGLQKGAEVFFKRRQRRPSKAREKLISEALAKGKEEMMFSPGALTAMQESLADLPCYRCKIKYRNHQDADHMWIECAEDLDQEK